MDKLYKLYKNAIKMSLVPISRQIIDDLIQNVN